ncbi:MAG: hypothetical protein KCHDKBKB_02008 [Elusimicrobia bacterium]|nr:hypothetical protein [Elusimicrobiota bacterium]
MAAADHQLGRGGGGGVEALVGGKSDGAAGECVVAPQFHGSRGLLHVVGQKIIAGLIHIQRISDGRIDPHILQYYGLGIRIIGEKDFIVGILRRNVCSVVPNSSPAQHKGGRIVGIDPVIGVGIDEI